MRLPALPHLPVAGQASSTSAGAPAPVSAQRTAAGTTAPSSPEIRPIAAANPIRPSFALQRAAADDLDEDAEDDTLPSPWWAPPAESPSQLPMGSGAGGDPGVSLQRSTAGSSGPSFSGLGATRGTAPAAPSAAQSLARGTSIQRSTGAPTRPQMPVRGAADHSHAPSAAAVPTPESSVSFPSRSIVSAPVVQTMPASGANARFGPSLAPPPLGAVPVQRAEAESPTPVPPPGADESAPRSERDLDELAQALFGRIRGRIRSELIHDREAKGLTFDSV